MREDYTVEYANRAFRRRFGVDRFEGRRCHELIFHEVRRCSDCGRACPMERASVSRRVERTTERELMPGGARFLELESVPVMGSDGALICFMERVRVREDAQSAAASGGIVARSAATRATIEAIGRVAALEDPVLFCGPGGSGKGAFARFLHENSRRAVNAFVKIDCAGLSEARFEDELLGRSERMGGARTGGLSAEPAGTLYFDEVAALSPGLQRRLLMLLETGLVREAGRAQSVPVDWRIVCATSAPEPEGLVREGLLREDLWLRLCVARIRVPALRERREDIEEIVRIMLGQASSEGSLKGVTPEAMEILRSRVWPGNLRELECALRRARILARGRAIRPEDLGADRTDGAAPLRRTETDQADADLLEEAQRWRGTRAGLARKLGVSERTLYRRLGEARGRCAGKPELE